MGDRSTGMDTERQTMALAAAKIGQYCRRPSGASPIGEHQHLDEAVVLGAALDFGDRVSVFCIGTTIEARRRGSRSSHSLAT